MSIKPEHFGALSNVELCRFFADDENPVIRELVIRLESASLPPGDPGHDRTFDSVSSNWQHTPQGHRHVRQ